MLFSIHRSAIFAGRILSGSAKTPQNQIEERWVERPEATLFVENRGRFFDGRLVTLLFGPLERPWLRGLYVDECPVGRPFGGPVQVIAPEYLISLTTGPPMQYMIRKDAVILKD